jgi:hypothetical protein
MTNLRVQRRTTIGGHAMTFVVASQGNYSRDFFGSDLLSAAFSGSSSNGFLLTLRRLLMRIHARLKLTSSAALVKFYSFRNGHALAFYGVWPNSWRCVYCGAARIIHAHPCDFTFLIGSSGRPSHESNVYAILNFFQVEPAPELAGFAAKALLSNPITTTRLPFYNSAEIRLTLS